MANTRTGVVLVVLVLVFAVPGVVLEQVEAVAKPLLVPVLKKPPAGPQKPFPVPPKVQSAVQNGLYRDLC